MLMGRPLLTSRSGGMGFKGFVTTLLLKALVIKIVTMGRWETKNVQNCVTSLMDYPLIDLEQSDLYTIYSFSNTRPSSLMISN
jgi:hypothetical protein